MEQTLFSSMNLSPTIERAIGLMGFEYATQIQSEAIPVIRTGVDVIAKSQTGTGKTVAFAIPAIEKIDTECEKARIQVLILCPTRELAMQAYDEILKLARFEKGIYPVAIYGGAPITKQCISLRQANIVIGTPGRVMDHMRRKSIKLKHLKMLILDEADEMLNMGFREDIETILSSAPEERQTILFSATMPPAIMKITDQFQRSPELIEINKSQVTLDNIQQRFIDVPHAVKKEALALLLQYYNPNRAIIFSGTKKMADELTEFLKEKNITADSIHSDIKQTQRTSTMQAFKSGKTAILIATDIAARGIDVNDIDYVINYDVPPNTEYYIHRIGRTGRAGKSGISLTLCSSRREISEMQMIARRTKSNIEEITLPTSIDVQQKGVVDACAKIEAQIEAETHEIYGRVVSALIGKGFSAEQIAEASLSLLYQEMSNPVETIAHKRSDRKDKGEKRKSGGSKYASIVLTVGRKSKITVNHLIGAIVDQTGLSKKDIGHIDILDDESYVEIPEDEMDMVVKVMANSKINGKKAQVYPLAFVGNNKSHYSEKGKKTRTYGKSAKGKSKKYH